MIIEEEFQKFYSIVSGIRRSFDPIYPMSQQLGDDVSRAKKLILEIEALRLDLLYARREDPAWKLEALKETGKRLTALMEDPVFAKDAQRRRLRIFSTELERGLVFDELKIPAHERNATVAQAIDIFMNRLAGVAATTPSGNNGSALRKVVPEQRLAPVKFAIYEHRLALARQSIEPAPADTENIERAREALLQQGGRILTSLEQSNCDRRVLESLRELHEGLSKKDNIIELGIMTIGVDRVCKSAACELPEALSGAIDGHLAGIGMCISQFTEWQRFSENVSKVELDTQDIENIKNTTTAIIRQLAERPEIADPDVPKTLKSLT